MNPSSPYLWKQTSLEGLLAPGQFQTCPEVSRYKDYKARTEVPATLPLPAIQALGQSLSVCRPQLPHWHSEGFELDDV